MPDDHVALIAHLLRRAGFGAGREELEEYSQKSYEQVVDDLVHPERFPEVEEDVLSRYYPQLASHDEWGSWNGKWIYRMVNSRRPLQEKIALFWHHVFATGWFKSEHTPTMIEQIEMFRRNGLAKLRDILLDLSRDPAMIYWLDNRENHKDAINENYGRELLELFSMGIGNYSETDVKVAARAFTGWTFKQPVPLYPYGHYPAEFLYDSDDHDDGEKTFLGETGKFDGEDVVEIIVKQPATAQFISRHLYNFFVADEPQVPAWSIEPPQDEEAIETLVTTYFESGGEIRSVMQTMFNSDFFKEARFKHVKSPAEFVASAIKLSGEFRSPTPGMVELGTAAIAMGQHLMNPPTVEGWHTGKEWIDGGTLNERVNFAVDHVNDPSKPGVRAIADRLVADGGSLSPEGFVDQCLELAGPIDAAPETRDALLQVAEADGDVRLQSEADRDAAAERVSRVLRLIVSSPEFQFA